MLARAEKHLILKINDDSAGTSDIIDNIAEMLFINKEGGLFIEDELGRNYHTKLTEYFIELFNNKVNCGRHSCFSVHTIPKFSIC